jgi:hypothetical protein
MALREDYPELHDIASENLRLDPVSQSACMRLGFGTPDRPLSEWVPLYLIASSAALVTQYDFKSLEDFGLDEDGLPPSENS